MRGMGLDRKGRDSREGGGEEDGKKGTDGGEGGDRGGERDGGRRAEWER